MISPLQIFQRGKHAITGELAAPNVLGAVVEFQRLQRLAPVGPALVTMAA